MCMSAQEKVRELTITMNDWALWKDYLVKKIESWKSGGGSALVAKSCPPLTIPWTVACQAPVHGILQARILEWVAISSSRGSSRPRNWTQVSHISGRHFNLRATREAQRRYYANNMKCQKLWVKKGLKTGQCQDNGRSGQCRGKEKLISYYGKRVINSCLEDVDLKPTDCWLFL